MNITGSAWQKQMKFVYKAAVYVYSDWLIMKLKVGLAINTLASFIRQGFDDSNWSINQIFGNTPTTGLIHQAGNLSVVPVEYFVCLSNCVG